MNEDTSVKIARTYHVTYKKSHFFWMPVILFSSLAAVLFDELIPTIYIGIEKNQEKFLIDRLDAENWIVYHA